MDTDAMMTVLQGFHHRIERRIAGMTPRKGGGGEWERELMDAALEVKCIWPIREYVRRGHETITEHVSGRLI